MEQTNNNIMIHYIELKQDMVDIVDKFNAFEPVFQQYEAERLEAIRLEAQRIEAERIEAERVEAERIEAERVEVERINKEKIRLERIRRLIAQHQENQRLERQKIDEERRLRLERQQRIERMNNRIEELNIKRVQEEILNLERTRNADNITIFKNKLVESNILNVHKRFLSEQILSNRTVNAMNTLNLRELNNCITATINDIYCERRIQKRTEYYEKVDNAFGNTTILAEVNKKADYACSPLYWAISAAKSQIVYKCRCGGSYTDGAYSTAKVNHFDTDKHKKYVILCLNANAPANT